jgi:CMP-N-acetylneuraminic acid synthetase
LKLLGLITARAGSKGLPGKNVKPLSGKPLIAYTIEAAQRSGAFDRLILSTDDAQAAAIARSLGCDVPFERPADLARDDTPHLPVVQHAVAWLAEHDHYRPDLVMILQPTSPLRQPHHIREAVDLIARTGASSVVSVSAPPAHYHPLRMLRVDESGEARLFVTGEPVRQRVKRRQELAPAWAINEAIYLLRSSVLADADPSLYGDRCVAYVMPPAYGLSIDTPEDFADVERAIQRLPPSPQRGAGGPAPSGT